MSRRTVAGVTVLCVIVIAFMVRAQEVDEESVNELLAEYLENSKLTESQVKRVKQILEDLLLFGQPETGGERNSDDNVSPTRTTTKSPIVSGLSHHNDTNSEPMQTNESTPRGGGNEKNKEAVGDKLYDNLFLMLQKVLDNQAKVAEMDEKLEDFLNEFNTMENKSLPLTNGQVSSPDGPTLEDVASGTSDSTQRNIEKENAPPLPSVLPTGNKIGPGQKGDGLNNGKPTADSSVTDSDPDNIGKTVGEPLGDHDFTGGHPTNDGQTGKNLIDTGGIGPFIDSENAPGASDKEQEGKKGLTLSNVGSEQSDIDSEQSDIDSEQFDIDSEQSSISSPRLLMMAIVFVATLTIVYVGYKKRRMIYIYIFEKDQRQRRGGNTSSHKYKLLPTSIKAATS